MVIADPSAQLLGLVRSYGDPAPAAAADGDQRAAGLLRRRFGLSLPPPFAGEVGAQEPVRRAAATDGAAIAAVKWRTFGTSYRGVLPDAFLDSREMVPPPSFWIGRAMVPPSRRHRLLVWGRPGTVYGYVDCGPAHPDEPDGDSVTAGEIYELYIDPTAQGAGGGSTLVEAAATWLGEVGFDSVELSALEANGRARGFYESLGWNPTGRVDHVELPAVAFDEVRYARRVRAGGS